MKNVTLWALNSLKEVGIPDHLTCLLRNLYLGQEATVSTRHGTMNGFKIGKQYVKAVYCHPTYLIYMQSISCEMPDWMKHKLKRWRHPNGRKLRGTKEPLDEGERGKWESWLKTQHLKTKIMASNPITSSQTDRETMETVADFTFLGFKIIVDGDSSHKIQRCLLLGRKAMNKPRQRIKKQRHHFDDKDPCSQSYGFSNSHVPMWELNHKEGCTPKNWCFRTVVLEKTLESPLDSKEIKPVNPKENQPWIFIGRTDAEAPILWSPDAKSWVIGKDPDAAKDWGQEENGVAKDKMVGWHHQLNGHEFEQTSGDSGGQRSLVCCSLWDCK